MMKRYSLLLLLIPLTLVVWLNVRAQTVSGTITFNGVPVPFTGTCTNCGTVSGSSSSGSSTSSSGSSTSGGSGSSSGVFAGGNLGVGVKVSGNKLIRSSSSGGAVQLIGTNINGLESGTSSQWNVFGQAPLSFWQSIINYGNQGLNTIRLPLNEASWMNYTCNSSVVPDPTNVYKSNVQNAVANATAAGFYVILDLHWSAPNDQFSVPRCPIGQSGFADNDHSIAFWTSVAGVFKTNPAVIFELFNEPFGDNNYSNWVTVSDTAGSEALLMVSGGTFNPFMEQNAANYNALTSINQTWTIAGLQAMLTAIRATGATNVILSPSIGWSVEIETWLTAHPTDSLSPAQLGAAWHTSNYNKGTTYISNVLNANVPIVITETQGFDSVLDGGADNSGYVWARSQSIGYLWLGWSAIPGNSLATSITLEGAPWYASVTPQ
jgi:endoglucanase